MDEPKIFLAMVPNIHETFLVRLLQDGKMHGEIIGEILGEILALKRRTTDRPVI